MSDNSLTDILQSIDQSTDEATISFGDVVKALKKRGFGPLLIAPCLVIIMPTGAIPGVPAFCGMFIILLCGQMLFNKQYPWLPKFIIQANIQHAKYTRAVAKVKPYTEKIDQWFASRLVVLTHPHAKRFVALLCILMASMIIVIGFIPFISVIPATVILLFALALSVNDGLIMAIGIIGSCVAFYYGATFI